MSFIKESYLAYKKVQEVLEKETSDHEISMARSELEGIADKATATSSMLEGMTESGNPLPAWVQSKITNASDYITSVHDYLKYNPQINESVSLEETTFEKIYQMQQDGKSVEDIAKELKLKPDLVKKVLGEDREWATSPLAKTLKEALSDTQIAQLKKEYEPLKGKTITTSQYQQLKNILFKLQDGDLEKLQKQNIPFASTGAATILRVRKAPVKITKVTVPGLEGMAEEIKVDKPAILKSLQDRLKKLESDPDHGGKQDMIAYVKSKIKMIQSMKEEVKKIAEEKSLFDDNHPNGGQGKSISEIEQMLKKEIQKGNFIGSNSYTVIEPGLTHFKQDQTITHKELLNNIKRYGANQFATLPDATFGEEVELTELESKRKRELQDRLNKLQYEKHFNHDANKEDLQKKIDVLKKQIEAVKEEAELKTESHYSMGQHVIYKPKSMTPRKAQIIQVTEPQVGAYYKIKISPTLMTYAKPDELELDEACWTGYKQVGLKKKGKRMVPNCVKENKRLYIESIVAVKNKAEKSGMPYSILKQVYDRGMAAWKGGHRPGATQVQWALARVNSFVTKSSGTWGGADSDLAKKVKG